MLLIENIDPIRAAEIATKWLKSKHNSVQIASSAFEGCYRFNLWTTNKKGAKIMKHSYRIVPF